MIHGYTKPVPRGKRTFKEEEEKRATVRALRERHKLMDIQQRLQYEYQFQEDAKRAPLDPYLNNYDPEELQPMMPQMPVDYARDEEEASQELWNILHRHLGERLKPGIHAKHWLDTKIHTMQESHFHKQLVVLDLQSNMLLLGDKGMRRVARWMIDYTESLEGIRRIDVPNHELTQIGLDLVSDMMPFSCVEVDVSGNTGKDWTKGVMKIAGALRERGGGVMYCGRATAPELELLKMAVSSNFEKGGHVVINVHRWGSATVALEIPSFIQYDAHFFAKPDWTQHTPEGTARKLSTSASAPAARQPTARGHRSSGVPSYLGGRLRISVPRLGS